MQNRDKPLILVAGATNFVGRAIVRHLVGQGCKVRCLLQPSRRVQQLPSGLTFSTASARFDDAPALRLAMQDVDTVVHATREENPDHVGQLRDHAERTQQLIVAARSVGVRRFIYLSRLGADQSSAYLLLRIKGESEITVQESGLEYTILQSALTYGQEDMFTNVSIMLAKMIPFVLPIPEVGRSRFQPLWVEDLARCVAEVVEREDLLESKIPVGGPEHFTLEQMMGQLLVAAGMHRRLVHTRLPLVTSAINLFETIFARNPTPSWWLDMVTVNNATELGAIPRRFGFEPRRFSDCLYYLRHRQPWRRNFFRFVLGYPIPDS